MFNNRVWWVKFCIMRVFRLKVNFFSWIQTLCSDCALTISDVDKRFFTFNRERNKKKSVRATFLDFGLWTVEESDKVENYRFLENCSMKFDENQRSQFWCPFLCDNRKLQIGSENFAFFLILHKLKEKIYNDSIFSSFDFC